MTENASFAGMQQPFHGGDEGSNPSGDVGSTHSAECQRRNNVTATCTRPSAKRAPEYRSLNDAIKRCHNPRARDFRWYGERGIRVCDRWRGADGWARFWDDMGPMPGRGYTLDRIDPDGNYEPGNCRWATIEAQQRNRRRHRLVTIGGVTRCASEWSEMYGQKRQRFITRLDCGWDPLVALTAPVGMRREAAHAA